MGLDNMEIVFPPWGWTDWTVGTASDPNVNGWYNVDVATDIPETQVAWMLAQGWYITDVRDDEDNEPLKIFDMQRDSFKGRAAMTDILHSYTTLFNEARQAQDAQYDDVVLLWSDTILKTQWQLNRAAENHNDYELLFLNTLDSIAQQVSYYAGLIEGEAAVVFNQVGDSINDVSAALAGYSSGHSAYVAAMEPLIAQMAANLVTFASDVEGLAAQFVTDYNALSAEVSGLEAAVQSVISVMGADYDSKAAELAALEAAALALSDQMGSDVTDLEDDLASPIAEAQGVISRLVLDYNASKSNLTGIESLAEAVITAMQDDYNTHGALVASLEDSAVDTLESHATSYLAKIAELEAAAAVAVSSLTAIADEADAAQTTYSGQITTSIGNMEAELLSLESGIAGYIADLEAALGPHDSAVDGVLALYLSDYETHAELTRGLLVAFDATEQARINERWDNSLTKEMQLLVDRGFYSSTIPTDVTTRNTRERGQQLTELRDKLNREKIEHEHRLYAELTSVRDKTLAGKQYLYKLQEASIQWKAEWSAKLFQHAMDVEKTIAGLRDSVLRAKMAVLEQKRVLTTTAFDWAQDARKAVADGYERLQALRQNMSQWRADNSFKLFAELVRVRTTTLDVYRQEMDNVLKLAAMLRSAREADLQNEHWRAEHYYKLADALRKAREAEMQVRQWKADVSVKLQGMLERVRSAQMGAYAKEADNSFRLGDQLEAARHVDFDVAKALQAARTQYVDFAADARSKIVRSLYSYLDSYTRGLTELSRLTLQKGEYLTNVRKSVLQDIMRARFQFASGLTEQQAAQTELHKMQLDIRNNLCVGLFRAMGEREWMKPEVQEFAQMILAMGDAGATQWVAQ